MTTSPKADFADLNVFTERFINDVHRSLLRVFQHRHENDGLEKKEIADFLGIHKSLVTRRLNGSSNLTLEVVSEMARAMKGKPVFDIVLYEDLTDGDQNTNHAIDPIRATSTNSSFYNNQITAT